MKTLFHMYPEIDLKNFEVPENFNWGLDWIDYLGKEKEDGKALIFRHEGRTLVCTFGEISDLSTRMAGYLETKEIKKGDRVILMMGNVPFLWISFVALTKIGAVVIPTATVMTEKDLRYRIEKSGACGIITDGQNACKLNSDLYGRMKVRAIGFGSTDLEGWDCMDEKELLKFTKPLNFPETRSDDPAIIYFTSGTAGNPKMVLHTHSSYAIGHYSTAMWIGIQEGSIHWNISSPGWAKHAWSSIFAPWNVGAATVAFHYEGSFNAEDHLFTISDLNVNSICASPTVWRMFILQNLKKYDWKNLKRATSAGEPLNREIIERFRDATGVTIRDGYGQTETVLQIGNFPGNKVKEGSMGTPSPFFNISVCDDQGKVLPPGVEGNITIETSPKRPIPLMVGYLMDEEKNMEVFKHGRYFTGDRAYMDDDGYFWYVGRNDDVIKSSGYRIGPFEVESALMESGMVAESAVVASPDPVRGAIVKAFVVLKKGYEQNQENADRLSDFAGKSTAPYKHPRIIEFVGSLDPVKTISGKIRRKDLREMEYGTIKKVINGREFRTSSMRGRENEDEEDPEGE
ncbi:MAG: acyl-CoA synthetase [Cuniculiplasma sp.]